MTFVTGPSAKGVGRGPDGHELEEGRLVCVGPVLEVVEEPNVDLYRVMPAASEAVKDVINEPPAEVPVPDLEPAPARVELPLSRWEYETRWGPGPGGGW